MPFHKNIVDFCHLLNCQTHYSNGDEFNDIDCIQPKECMES